MAIPHLFSELKRRNVYKVAVAYAVVAWLLIQIATQVFPFFDVPGWAVRLLVLFLVAGFPIALVIAWAFELTPDGIKRTEEVAQAPARAGRGWLWLVLIAALAASGLLWFQKSAQQKAASADARSIAVLPFENLSENKENAYFVDGMQDEVITRLAKIGQLRVISRSSTQRYKTRPDNLAQIARELGVSHLVEGTVQRVGDRVRINVQLIRAPNESHLWAEIYDRNLTDIFAVQTELATRIADSLQATLSGAERKAVAEKPTENLAAYDAYLRGIDLDARPGQTEENARKSVDAFAEAVRLDPHFAQAWAALAEGHANLYFLQFDPTAERKVAARSAMETATRLNPAAPETQLAKAYYRYHVERDYEGARVAFEQLRGQMPSNSEVLLALARIARRQSRWSDSVGLFEQAALLNPRDTYLCMDRAWTFSMLRQFAATADQIARALAISPDDPEVLVSKVKLLHVTGDLAGAAAVLARIPAGSTSGQAEGLRVTQAMWQRHFDQAAEIIKSEMADPKGSAEDRSVALLRLGDAQWFGGKKEEAQETYRQAKAALEPLRQEQPNSPFIAIGLGFCAAGLGEKELALREAERAVSLLSAAQDPVFGPGMEENLAAVEAMVGEGARAMERIERLLSTPYGAFPLTLASLRLDPTWDPLRNQPRFQALLNGPDPKTSYR
ncbi:MAG: tetratricopeptide repeat protein [Chthoniobacterales bacterium]